LKRVYLLLFFFCQLLLPSVSNATHIVGGEIYYDCLGNNQFRIVLKVYRDCLLGEAPFDNPANVAIYRPNGSLYENLQMNFAGSTIIPLNQISPCIQSTITLCVEEAVYQKIITLPSNPGGYNLVYQRCCRNFSIINIIDPGATGSTYTINIPESSFTECNSSPRYNTLPPIIWCINDPILYSHSASDPDGDSLVYYFCDPYEGATTDAPMPIPPGPPPFGFVNFTPPYTATNPIAANPQLSIDPVTGFITGVPTQAGKYVVAICVDEYRNGVLLSTNKRDYQYNILNCNGGTTAQFIAPTANINSPFICNGLDVNFINQSENGFAYQWDFGVPNISTDISYLANPVYIFPDTGVYNVSLIVNPGEECADTTSLEIAVYRELIAQLDEPQGQCIEGNSFDFEAQGTFEANASFTWEFSGPSSIPLSNLQDQNGISYSEAGVFPVYFTITTNHCIARDTIDINVYPVLSVDFDVNNQNACAPATLVFTNNSVTSFGARYYWNFGDGATSTERNPTHAYNDEGLYSVSLIVINTVGCIDTISLEYPNFILIRPRPDAGILVSPQRTNILQPNVNFSDVSEGQISSWMNTGTGVQIFEESSIYTYRDTGYFNAYAIALNEQGCYDTANVIVRIDPVYSIYFPNAFSPNGDDINDFFSPKGEGFKTYEMAIFDRWGEEVFLSKQLDATWDGRSNDGKYISPLGVYNYKVWVRDVFNNDHIYTGYVVLIR
jgi:gliding motility-associated-like protein